MYFQCGLCFLSPAFFLSHFFGGDDHEPYHDLTQGYPLLTFCIVPCLCRTDQEIQTYTIAVINALFLKAPDERRQVRCISLS